MAKSCFFLLTHSITWTLRFHWHNAFCTVGFDKSGEFCFSFSHKLPHEDYSALTKWIKSRNKLHTSHLTCRFILKIVSETKMVFILNMTHVVPKIVEMLFHINLHYYAVKNLVPSWHIDSGIWYWAVWVWKNKALFTYNSVGQIWGQL